HRDDRRGHPRPEEQRLRRSRGAPALSHTQPASVLVHVPTPPSRAAVLVDSRRGAPGRAPRSWRRRTAPSPAPRPGAVAGGGPDETRAPPPPGGGRRSGRAAVAVAVAVVLRQVVLRQDGPEHLDAPLVERPVVD